MKKVLLLLCALCTFGLVAADDISDLKIYINPGHGGWEELNDRHIATIPFPQMKDDHIDTLGFWESSSNLKVAFSLREYLLAAGVKSENIKLSRETNASGTRDIGTTTWDGTTITAEMVDSAEGDRSFSVIKEEARAMNPDLLLSIHSNAATVGAAANYVVAFIEGDSAKCGEGANTGREYAADTVSYDYAEKIVKWQLDPLDTYHEAPNGYIWSYYNEWSLIRTTEGVAAYRPTVLCEASFHSYLPNTHRFLNRDYQKEEAYRFLLGLYDIFGGKPTTGVVCGDVRSRKEKATIGFGKIITGKDQYQPLDSAFVELLQDGQVVKSYTTDNYKNGLYFFFDVTPGTYMVRVSKNNYATDSTEVTIDTSDLSTSVATANFRLASTGEEPSPEQKYVDGNLGEFNTVIKDSALTVKRALSHGKYLFVLAFDSNNTPYIYRVNKSGVIVQQFPTNECTVNMAGGLTVGDIALSSDGYLYAINRENGMSAYETEYGNKIYTWAADGTMTMLYENFYNSQCYSTANFVIGDPGASLTFIGDHNNGAIVFTSENANPASSTYHKVRYVGLQIQYGEVVGRAINLPNPDIFTTTIGTEYALHTYGNDIILSGSKTNHTEMTVIWTNDTQSSTVCTRTDLSGVLGFNIGDYGETTSMFVPTSTGIDIYDINDAFTGTEKETVAFDSTITTGYLTAGAFAGDTLWLIRDGYLQVLVPAEPQAGITVNVQVPEGTPNCFFYGALSGNEWADMTMIDSLHYTINFADKTADDLGWGYKFAWDKTNWNTQVAPETTYTVTDGSLIVIPGWQVAPGTTYQYTTYTEWNIKYAPDWTWQSLTPLEGVANTWTKEITWQGNGMNVSSCAECPIKQDWYPADQITGGDIAAGTPVIVKLTVVDDNTITLELVDNTPQGVEDIDGQTLSPRKVMMNGQLYIIRNGHLYTAEGQIVE